MSTMELYRKSQRRGGQWYRIEFYKRFAFPASCLVLMLVGVPLGLSLAAAARAPALCSPSRWSSSITFFR